MHKQLKLLTIAISVFFSYTLQAEEADLSKQLANPISALISLPIQANYDDNFGADDNGSVTRINIQPVIPISISKDWNMISRTILPIIDQRNIPAKGSSDSGMGDVVQSFFFSPKKPTDSGLIWGVGPVLLLDTASDKNLGGEKWGAGPTAVLLKQSGSWTYGFLGNHIESFAGDNDRADISATFVQPFASYVTPSKLTLALNTESTYDWESKNWSVPINFTAMQMLKIDKQIMQLGGGLRYWADSPDNGPEGWGFRLQLTLLFPK